MARNFKCPYDSLSEEACVKAQALVSRQDKNLISSIIPDHGVFTFLIQHAFANIAERIRSNGLTYSPESSELVLSWIRGDAVNTTPSSPLRVSLGHGEESVHPALAGVSDSCSEPQAHTRPERLGKLRAGQQKVKEKRESREG